jgi:Cu+-exporting ATPase
MSFPRFRHSVLSSCLCSCVPTIKTTLSSLTPTPSVVDVSVVSQCVTVQHSTLLPREAIESSLYLAGFDLASKPTNLHPLPQAFLADRIRKHVEQCAACAQDLTENTGEKSGLSSDGLLVNSGPPLANAFESEDATAAITHSPSPSLTQVQLSIGGMTCASCVTTITRAAVDIQGVSDVNVDLLGKSASAIVMQPELVDDIVKRVEEIGYECTVVLVEPVVPVRKSDKAGRKGARKVEATNQLDEGPAVADTEQSRRIVAIQINGMFCQ